MSRDLDCAGIEPCESDSGLAGRSGPPLGAFAGRRVATFVVVNPAILLVCEWGAVGLKRIRCRIYPADGALPLTAVRAGSTD